MTTTLETLPATWDDVRDIAFFRVTQDLFPSAFVYGAGVLLASYDDETDELVTTNANPDVSQHTSTQPSPTLRASHLN